MFYKRLYDGNKRIYLNPHTKNYSPLTEKTSSPLLKKWQQQPGNDEDASKKKIRRRLQKANSYTHKVYKVESQRS